MKIENNYLKIIANLPLILKNNFILLNHLTPQDEKTGRVFLAFK